MEGSAFARAAAVRRLSARAAILLGDLVWTEARSRLTLGLDGGSRIHLGPEAQLVVDRFIATTGGELRFGAGALVFDRDDDLDKIDLEIRTVYGQIGVRGTRFFAGPSNGVFAVFVERGAVAVSAGGTIRRLEAGEGVDMTDPATPPGPVARWSAERTEAAFRSVFG
ncbi:FecR domain-containing protein [Methylobrevis sp. L22]|uniref:FecR domain-containing protein n=2 Tax=Methylobrevis albus TaxID=2793297 RepID=A0A931MZP4_9HYPH|nr:FecR domain-containing protein [Methylobrevis albus]